MEFQGQIQRIVMKIMLEDRLIGRKAIRLPNRHVTIQHVVESIIDVMWRFRVVRVTLIKPRIIMIIQEEERRMIMEDEEEVWNTEGGFIDDQVAGMGIRNKLIGDSGLVGFVRVHVAEFGFMKKEAAKCT